MSDPTIFISAGEASGEHYGALLIEALKRRLAASGRSARFIGMGGLRMADAGLERIVRAEDVAVMGITEVIRHLPRIYREFRKLSNAIRRGRPAVAVLIDFPDVHLRLARQLHDLGIPVIYFVSPQLWAWKKHRMRLVQRFVDRMLVIFPFEEPFYREHGVPAEFVGHPLAGLPLPSISRADFARLHGLSPNHAWIGLLPGSRAREIRYNLPEMLTAARLLDAQRGESDNLEFILPLAPTLNPAQRQMALDLLAAHAAGLPVRVCDDARAALFHARASVVASGTATVEAALIGNPFVVVYRVSPLTYAIAQRVVRVPHVAMVNLVAGRRIVPELIQHDFRAQNIVRHVAPLLPDGPQRQSMMQELAKVCDLLSGSPGAEGEERGGAIDRVAVTVLRQLTLSSPVGGSVAL